MELSKARPQQALTLQDKHRELSARESKLNAIVSMLSQLGVRRQAKQDLEDYLLFACDLERYHLGDIENGLKACGSARRQEGETAFPGVGIMTDFIESVRDTRVNFENQLRDQREIAALRQHRKDFPEQYEPDEDERTRMDALNAKLAQCGTFPRATPRRQTEPMATKPIEATETKCPHCDKSLPLPKNMRMWTADQVLEFGAQLKEIERLAEANRAQEVEVAHAGN